MLYTRQSFTLPSTNKQLSDLEYEIRVGARCPDCKEKIEECICDADDKLLGT